MTKTFKVELTAGNTVEVEPVLKVCVNGNWSYEFFTQPIADVDGQEYDTFRVFDNGQVSGTLSESYYVYDEISHEFVDSDKLYREAVERDDEFEDHTEFALAEFASEED
ncbi:MULTISPECIES: hypothetical protein [unclassified Exiguobacterium]|uniref:hypothetical protein n=1 Tax=unclassified Exiguobacterium TaxID=2644629 RepID=UPI001BE7337C|nr:MULTISPECIES: hypothetical protein [unclassified Exiguobacterium]